MASQVKAQLKGGEEWYQVTAAHSVFLNYVGRWVCMPEERWVKLEFPGEAAKVQAPECSMERGDWDSGTQTKKTQAISEMHAETGPDKGTGLLRDGKGKSLAWARG